MVVVLLCFAAALFAAYRVASRLAQDTLLHLSALTLLLFAINLILPVIYAGVIGQLNAAGLLIGGMLLWGGEIALAGRLRPLPPVETSGGDRRWLLLRRTALILGTALAVIVNLNNAIRVTMIIGPIAHVDVAWHYLPNMINLVQAGTLHHFNGLSAYFPAAFESLFAWELTLVRSFRLVPVFNLIAYALIAAYSIMILQLLLRQRSAVVRDLAAALLLNFIAVTPEIINQVISSGKNDVFLTAGALVLVYYWLRFWFVERDQRDLVLVGTAAGLMLSTKLTGAIWLTALAALHVIGLLTTEGRARWLPALIRHGLAVGVPFAILLLPWAVRIALDPSAIAQNAEATAIANQYTIARLWLHPSFRLHDWRWPLVVVFILALNAGLLVLLALLRRRWLIALLCAALVAGLWLQAMDIYIWQHFGLYLTVIISGVMLTAAWVRARSAQALAAASVVAMSVLVLAQYTFFPYSAWVYEKPLAGYTTLAVNYRYTLALYVLFLIGQVTFIAFALSAPPQAQADSKPLRSRSPLPLTVPAFAALSLLFGLFALIGDPALMWRHYGYFSGRSGYASPFFERFNTNVRAVSIYSLNAPPSALYGQALTNTVYYATDQRTGYYGDQAYRWDEIESLIDALALDYIVVSFNYPEVAQSALEPTPEVLAEIDKLREHLPVVYEDPVVTLFATANADPLQAALALGGGS